MTLLVATPVRAAELATAQVSLGYAEFRERLVRLMPDYKSLSGSVTFSLDVVRARNRIVGFLLARPDLADVTHVLWVDDDQWTDDVNIVPEMVKACRGILAAPYTNKKAPVRWIHQKIGTRLVIGTGFTMMTRECIDRVATHADWYTDLPGGLRCPNVFGQMLVKVGGKTTLLSEDYSFCLRAHDAGVPVELYTGPGVIQHAGGHAWSARDMPGDIVKA